ncbi:hypothetical protein MED193_18859 [Roseobacter sp. MED193]|uniref:hypothetical protein n=1 Tax=Roseobacter sp. MED193 TaxID=314262 RepID=UPI000068B810|nr:hypothetical protein [Roseobacter sp. MED193]EAQ47283.1 hypothetical protein MED193_18859 [Roseobacter sp. MED193]
MTVPTLPLHLVGSLERGLVASVTAATSGFTGSQQVQDWGGEWWEFTFEIALTRGRDARRLAAFFAGLGGMRGRFLFCDPSAGRSDLLADPIVSGAGQTGNALVTSGWAPSSPALEAGDFISLGSDTDTRLYQITADAVANGSGAATLKITPRLRSSPLNGAALEIIAPAVLLRLTGPVPTRITRADSHRFSVTAREAL